MIIASHTDPSGFSVHIESDGKAGPFRVARFDERGFFTETGIRRESDARELAEKLGMPKAAK